MNIAGLHQMAVILNTYGRINIRNCAGADILRLGLRLMIEYERDREAQLGHR